jgi:exosortase H (IPTLxxWG-CTERM-specific)
MFRRNMEPLSPLPMQPQRIMWGKRRGAGRLNPEGDCVNIDQPGMGSDRRALAFAITFAAIAVGGIAVLLIPAVDENVVNPFTAGLVDVCAGLLKLFDGRVTATGNILAITGTGAAVSVENGCNAVEVCLLLSAAIIAWPASIRARVVGVLIGIAAIQTVNLARIISLLYLSFYSPPLFEFFHLYVWETMIMLEAVLLFFLWMRRQGAGRAEAEPQST